MLQQRGERELERQKERACENAAMPPIVSTLCEQLPAILESEPVQLAYLYGSTVTGQTTPFSDVDIALFVGTVLAPLERLRLILRVQLALADRCGIKNADVRVMDQAPLVFCGRVITCGMLVYVRDDRVRVAFETTTRMLYLDYLPIYRQLQTALFEAIQERGVNG